MVVIDEPGDVHIAEAVTVSQAKVFLVQVGRDAFDAAAGLGQFAGIHQGDAPGFGPLLVDFHAVVGHVESDIGSMGEVVGEEFLDDIAAIAQADDEVIDAVAGVVLHDVPEDRA